MSDPGPLFDRPVAPGGYAWWYVDALSDDGRHGLTIIGFVGSVFSPYYAWARRRDRTHLADPLDHCAINVALYGAAGKRWTMTERGRGRVERNPAALRIGPSAMQWTPDGLTIEVDEITVPWPSRVSGRIRLRPAALNEQVWTLDTRGRHRWRPIAPCARVEVRLQRPELTWLGHGYFDHNHGDEPLEAGFARWDWSRATLADGDAAVLYDITRRDGTDLALSLRFDRAGRVRRLDPPPRAALPRSLWQVERGTRADHGHAAKVTQSLEDAPFYARSLVDTRLFGEPAKAVHESLHLGRFASPLVQWMLPFRMPRVR